MARPIGSKNKKKNPIQTFSETLDAWDEMERQVDWEDVAKKCQAGLSKEIIENDNLRAANNQLQSINYNQAIVIQYLEQKIENLTVRSR